MSKREDYISWNDYFMSIALLSAQRSKDPSTQVGACIVDLNYKVVGIGYNGFPMGCNDEDLPWEREGEPLETKYPYVVHSEINAIHNSTGSLKDAVIYCTLFPCNECTKSIIQTGIKGIIYLSDKYHDTDSHIASRKMLNLANIKYAKYIPNSDQIVLKLKE
jgi:dCMP deaminase